MDIKTGLSIYNKQWLIEPQAALQMLDFWEMVKAGEMKWDYRKAKSQSEETQLSTFQVYQKFFQKEGIVMAPESAWDMEDFKGFDGASVAIIPVTGPLMKYDFCGMFGTNTIRQLVQMASGTESVKAIMFLHDSPGGTVDGTQALADTVRASQKRTISLITGMMCSADYWIGSASDEVYASAKTDIIGSIGTMCSFYDNSKALEARGIVLREYYATESRDKNRAGKEAMQGDGKTLIQETLDPLNDVFLSAVKSYRAGKIDTSKENVLTGKTYTSEKALEHGLIDGIKSFEEVLDMAVKSNGAAPRRTIFSRNKTNNKMTLAELNAQHPELVAQIQNDAVQAERDRVGAWMAFNDVDAEAVAKGIEDGTQVTQKVIAEMSRKSMSAAKLDGMKKESPGAIKTEEVKTEEEGATAEVKAFEATVRKNLGLKTN